MEIQKGKLAKCQYSQVRYSHVNSLPGESAVLTADPWSFLHGTLLKNIEKSVGANRKRYKRANYYAKLSEDFYRASKNTDMPTKATLLYYGMMNLVKCYLSTKGVELETTIEHHGLSLSQDKKYNVAVAGKYKNAVNIYEEFCKLLGTPVKGKHDLNLRHVFTHIPELHGICFNLGFIKKPKFIPVEINFFVNESNTYLFTEIAYNKSNEQASDTDKFLSGKRKDYFKEVYTCDGWINFRSQKRKKLTKDNWNTIYKNVLKEYREFDLASLLTRNGYRYYCNLRSGTYHHLANAYVMMFYLGTAARYRPTEIEDVMLGELRPLATEAAALCPNQFLYQLVSLITDKLCVIPYADI